MSLDRDSIPLKPSPVVRRGELMFVFFVIFYCSLVLVSLKVLFVTAAFCCTV